MMGRHEEQDPWLHDWLRMMRPVFVVVAQVSTGLVVHAGTVWLYYTTVAH
jgi:hypothetical protein